MTGSVKIDQTSDVAVITIDHPPVNALSQSVRAQLLEAVRVLENDDSVQALVITGAGKIFVGGADIREFGKPPREPFLPDVINALEDCKKPVVAAINGAALGGGLEIALGAHARVSVPTAQVGLPEVTLGLLPGAGGTQRLPRLTGLASALDLITSGRRVSAREANELGIIEAVFPKEDLLAAAINMARDLAENTSRIVRTGLQARPEDPGKVIEEARKKTAQRYRGEVARLTAIDAVEAATRLDRAEGLKEERRLFLELMQTPERAALIHAFFSERKASNLPELDGTVSPEFETLGVIGGGTMGSGIATSALLAGLGVTLVERDQALTDRARETISRNLEGAVKRGKLTAENLHAILTERLKTATSYDALAEADIIIEAVFESLDVKREVFQTLDGIAKPGATLATNTSYLDVNEIAEATGRPEDVIGLHFFSPAHVMRLLEVVIAKKTLPSHVARAFALARKLGKVAVPAGVCDGFIGNRILAHYKLAADYMMMDGATPYEIDEALVAFGFAMGPFQVSDLAGIDIGYAAKQRRAASRHPRERVVNVADQLFERNWLGRKTGRGFYLYDEQAPKGRPDPEVLEIVEATRSTAGITARTFTADDIQRRYMAAMINEAARVLEDGIARRPSDIDVVFLTGYGFPRWRGGPLHYADTYGLGNVLADLRSFAAEDDHYWSPAPLLERLVAEGRTFADLNLEADAATEQDKGTA